MYRRVQWIRSGSSKMCPLLRKEALEWYRQVNYMPCFLQRTILSFKQRWRKLPVIVQLNDDLGINEARFMAFKSSAKIIKELPVINSFAARVTQKQLEALTKSPGVHRIWYDRPVHAVLDVASPVTRANQVWETGYTGRGVTVAVLDTGIYDHPDFSSPHNRITGFVDLINGSSAPYDDHGHGTHVAGDIGSGGNKSTGTYQGPAPEANLVGVKVMDKYGMGSLSTVIEGLDWCIRKKDELGISIVNLSLGSSATESYRHDPLCQAVEQVWSKGMVVCAAAGNDGPTEKTINSPGIDPVIITVGALDDGNTIDSVDDSIAEFSSRGPTVDGLVKPDVVAPGVNITSLTSPGGKHSKKNKSNTDPWYISMSGTSMATPICAGVVALMLQANPTLTPDEIKQYLKKTSVDMGHNSFLQGNGLIDAQQAVQAVTKKSGLATNHP